MGDEIAGFTAKYGPTILLVLAIVSPVGALSWRLSGQLTVLTERVASIGGKVDELRGEAGGLAKQVGEIKVSMARLDERLSLTEVRVK